MTKDITLWARLATTPPTFCRKPPPAICHRLPQWDRKGSEILEVVKWAEDSVKHTTVWEQDNNSLHKKRQLTDFPCSISSKDFTKFPLKNAHNDSYGCYQYPSTLPPFSLTHAIRGIQSQPIISGQPRGMRKLIREDRQWELLQPPRARTANRT